MGEKLEVTDVREEWDQERRQDDVTPRKWRVTFELTLVGPWSIDHALDAVKKHIEERWSAGKLMGIPVPVGQSVAEEK